MGMQRKTRITAAAAAALCLGAGAWYAAGAQASATGQASLAAYDSQGHPGHPGAGPIKHVVVLFQENVSFDHYFATYPKAANTDGTKFTPARHTPRADTVTNAGLVNGKNPNLYQPFRLSSNQAMTCDQNHSYLPEQKAANKGANDQYVQQTSVDTCTGLYGAPGLTMGYYDGNTVTGMWNYAQHYAMSDNAYSSTYGPSTPGALNLISGQTHAATAVDPVTHKPTTDPYAVVDPDASGVGTVINDPDPAYDDCSDKNHTSTNNLATLSGKNVGDLLNAKGVTWGWFQGGFAPTTKAGNGTTYAVCGAAHTNVGGASVVDYSPHHNPFAYYESTANPHHLPPSSTWAIGRTDQANHNYDLTDFSRALKAGNLPAVSYLKAGEYQDGHAAYSDPIDEQHFLVEQINAIQKSKYWKDTAIVVAYDDSDGWYDHTSSPVRTGSTSSTNDGAACKAASVNFGGYQDRCGPGPRTPLLVISPFTKPNTVSHTPMEQTSILRFIEDNWKTGRVGDGSFDQRANSLAAMLQTHGRPNGRLLLNADGSVQSGSHH
ncbi:phospholipase C [Luteipulveratus mongoliensis]|uniref:phospholipase C n=1 Tax=Luteipulveratus mongoliensis TaxID=571913 RepID=UPI000696B353|nr:alkaline phosphatase family protein [Luteipulveratus mongoliensis]